MKKIYLALAVIVIVPVLSGVYIYFAETKCDELVRLIEKAEDAGGSGEKFFSEARKLWGQLEGIYGVSANHCMIEEVNESFTKAEAWLKLREINLYRAEIRWLKTLIERIAENEYPTAYNIF